MVYAFEDLEFEPHSNTLKRAEITINIGSIQLKLLKCLIYKYPQVASLDDLKVAGWDWDPLSDDNESKQVTDNAVTKEIQRLREYIGDGEASKTYIETIRREGYRLITPVSRRPSIPQIDRNQPFVTGLPVVHPSQFFGRQAELRHLLGLWSGSLQNAAIIGPRRSGKTSFLYHLQFINTTQPYYWRPGQREKLSCPHCNFVYVNFQEQKNQTKSGFFRCVLEDLMLPIPEDCDLEIFDEIVTNQLRSGTVILLDEIDVAVNLYHEFDTTFWNSMRALCSRQQRNIVFAITSSLDIDKLEELTEQNSNSSPFFNVFGTVTYLGDIEEEECIEIINISPIPFSNEDRNWIIEKSRKSIFLLQILCYERLAYLKEGNMSHKWKENGLRQLERFQKKG